jgi:hypothetical protein
MTGPQAPGPNGLASPSIPGQPGQSGLTPGAAAHAAAGALWSSVDARAQRAVADYINQNVGVPRSRSMSCTIPLGAGTPTPGWFTSIAIFQNVRVTAWMVQALVMGMLSIDLLTSNTFQDPTQEPILASIITGNIIDTDTLVAGGMFVPGVVGMTGGVGGGCTVTDNWIAVNGFGAYSFDTSQWSQREIASNTMLHVIVNSATTIAQATLGLQFTDLQGKTIQT